MKNQKYMFLVVVSSIPLGLAQLYRLLPSDFGEYLNAFFNAIVVVLFFFNFIIENIS